MIEARVTIKLELPDGLVEALRALAAALPSGATRLAAATIPAVADPPRAKKNAVVDGRSGPDGVVERPDSPAARDLAPANAEGGGQQTDV